MAGYVGTKAVLLSTTAANVGGDADIGGELTVDTSTLHVDSTNNRVGIGTDSPDTVLNVVSSITQAKFEGSVQGNIVIEKSGAEGFSIYSSAAGTLGFYDNNSSAERMRIDASGRVTKPYQPSFFASGNQGFQTTASGGTIVLDTTSFNVGSHYSTSTGRFTAPVAGKYFVSFTSYTESTGTITLKKNGSDFTVTDVAFLYLPNNVSARSGGISGLIHLNANDYMHFGARNNQQVYYYQGHTTFSAFLIG